MPIISLDTYPSWVALTLGLHTTPLASDTTLLLGRSSLAVDNTTNKFVDVAVAGKIRTGTSPTGGVIEVWAYSGIDGTPAYPDTILGTDADRTLTSANVKASALRLLWSTSVDAVSNRDYFIPPTSLQQLFGQVPSHWGLFVTQSTGAALNSTGSSHVISYRGTKFASA